MSEQIEKSTAGAGRGLFGTTRWTEIFDARSADEPRKRDALEGLLTRYWKPVYCYLRCRGLDTEDARDITQGFFHEIVLGHRLIEKADRARGRFRTFLLRCLNRYTANIRRAQRAKRRAPEGGRIRLNQLGRVRLPEPVHYATPVEIFDYAWASALLDQVIAEVAGKCREKGNATHWDLFRERILLPAMHNIESPSLANLCEKYRIQSKLKASNMIFTVKRYFQAVLRRHVRQFVGSDADVDEEISHLMKIFSRRAAIF